MNFVISKYDSRCFHLAVAQLCFRFVTLVGNVERKMGRKFILESARLFNKCKKLISQVSRKSKWRGFGGGGRVM